MQQNPKRNVLLLRSPEPQNDRYEAAFISSASQQLGNRYEYHPISVNPLETVHVNLDELERIVGAGSEGVGGRYDGVIITSGRSCEAWACVVRNLEGRAGKRQDGGNWLNTPFYVVGHSTHASLSQIRTAFPTSPYVPIVILGEASGTGEQLSAFILGDLKTRGVEGAKLLYLTGDKNRDTVPALLKQGGVELVPVQVYKTQGSSRFGRDLDQAIIQHKCSLGQGVYVGPDSWWIVYFSPSSAEFTTPFLREYFHLASVGFEATLNVGESTNNSGLTPALIAAIGPTTGNAITDTLNLKVDAMAEKPTPESLVDSIRGIDHKRADRGGTYAI